MRIVGVVLGMAVSESRPVQGGDDASSVPYPDTRAVSFGPATSRIVADGLEALKRLRQSSPSAELTLGSHGVAGLAAAACLGLPCRSEPLASPSPKTASSVSSDAMLRMLEGLIRRAVDEGDPLSEAGAPWTSPADVQRWLLASVGGELTGDDLALLRRVGFVAWTVHTATDFDAALAAPYSRDVCAIAGALAGAVHGAQAIPSRWTTYLHGDGEGTAGEGACRIGFADLRDLALRLAGARVPPESPLDPAVEPVEIAPNLLICNLAGAASVPSDRAIISLCRVGDRFAEFPERREFLLLDRPVPHNPGLAVLLDDVIASVDDYLAAGRQVVVHCHTGASRTGFVIRAWLMRHRGMTEQAAASFISERWPILDLHNESFTALLREGWSVEH